MKETQTYSAELNDIVTRSEFLGVTTKDFTVSKAAVVAKNFTNAGFSPLKKRRFEVMGTELRTDSVKAIMKEKMDAYYSIPDNIEEEDAFFVGDMGEIIRQHLQWKEMLPRVEPFYAMKCCPDPMVIKTLADLGTGFDCASRSEIETALSYGIDPSNIIYANPCKQASHLRYAHTKGVRTLTFDNADELRKIKQHMPNARCVVRILGFDASRSLCNFSTKFGAKPDLVPGLLKVARELDLDVVGVSFHVGSGCFDANVFGQAVASAANVVDVAKEFGYDMSLVDIGGGYPCSGTGTEGITFAQIAAVLRPAINALIPPHIRVIAEPGRYYAGSAFTLAVNVVARRVVPRDSVLRIDNMVDSAVFVTPLAGDEHPAYMYYINDGMYGSFNCITFDHAVVTPRVLAKSGDFKFDVNSKPDDQFQCSIWGPTCDSIDCITKEGLLPELNVGDWMYFENMGAYTLAAASKFNGFKKTEIIYTNTYRGRD
ncbi:Antizyme inhibitor 1 [Physocladia obscura]|uniref:ornithine decarboxylase n=1 Tax=Physocladia obscura TaxID=109957 RepID=A0AAD5XLE8_9FUNG|nr:Antizyme inhibitor 1 [Physocladia obscura]